MSQKFQFPYVIDDPELFKKDEYKLMRLDEPRGIPFNLGFDIEVCD